MSAPPVFGAEPDGRWSIGSAVVAYWWDYSTKTNGFEEKNHVGQVIGIKKDEVQGWRITITFGPMFDLLFPTEFNPEQLFLEEQQGGGCCGS